MHSSEGSVSLSTKPIGLAGPLTNPLEHKFSPYANNGGYVGVEISGGSVVNVVGHVMRF
jgi:hypothetical protein